MIHYCWIECVLVTANKAAEGRSVLEYDDVMQFAVLCPPTRYLVPGILRGEEFNKSLTSAYHGAARAQTPMAIPS